jgi:hypothetical protein
MRKLVSLGAVLFMLGIAFLTKPANALPWCDCDFCAAHPNLVCDDTEHASNFYCYVYSSFYCSNFVDTSPSGKGADEAASLSSLSGASSPAGRVCVSEPILAPSF